MHSDTSVLVVYQHYCVEFRQPVYLPFWLKKQEYSVDTSYLLGHPTSLAREFRELWVKDSDNSITFLRTLFLCPRPHEPCDGELRTS